MVKLVHSRTYIKTSTKNVLNFMIWVWLGGTLAKYCITAFSEECSLPPTNVIQVSNLHCNQRLVLLLNLLRGEYFQIVRFLIKHWYHKTKQALKKTTKIRKWKWQRWTVVVFAKMDNFDNFNTVFITVVTGIVWIGITMPRQEICSSRANRSYLKRLENWRKGQILSKV